MQNHLLKTQEVIKRLVGQDIENVCRDICIPRTQTGAFSKLEAKMNLLIEQTPPTDRTTKQKLENLCNMERQSFDTNILDFWKNTKISDPEMGRLIDVALAVPSTQVSVERAFSALATILTKLRSKLSKETINNILIVKLNKNLIKDLNIEK